MFSFIHTYIVLYSNRRQNSEKTPFFLYVVPWTTIYGRVTLVSLATTILPSLSRMSLRANNKLVTIWDRQTETTDGETNEEKWKSFTYWVSHNSCLFSYYSVYITVQTRNMGHPVYYWSSHNFGRPVVVPGRFLAALAGSMLPAAEDGGLRSEKG